MRILGISGSLRRDSHNTMLLRAVADMLPPGARLELFSGLRAVEPFDEDDEPTARVPAGVHALRSAISESDRLLIATPEYNSSIPGQLKNALDWASRPRATSVLYDKPVAVIGASTGLFGAVWAQAELRKVLQSSGARVLDRELPLMQAVGQFDELGRLVDPDVRTQLSEHVDALLGLDHATVAASAAA